MIDKLPFVPVIGKEEDIKSSSPKDGYLYFSTNTKKIFCGFNEQFLMMGGSTGIYFGKRTLTDDEIDESELFFDYEEFENLENKDSLNKDDLILNIPDGCFYRIIEILETSIKAKRLTIAGSGGGGSGSGTSVKINVVGLNNSADGNTQFFLASKPENTYIDFKVLQFPTVPENYITKIEYKVNGTLIYTDQKARQFNEPIRFTELAEYLKNHNKVSEKQNLSIKVYDFIGSRTEWSSSFPFYYMTLDLTTENELFEKFTLLDTEQQSISYKFNIDAIAVSAPKLNWQLINTENNITITGMTSISDLSNLRVARFNVATNTLLNNLGVYDLQVYFSGNIGTAAEPIIVESNITHNYIFFTTEETTALFFKSNFIDQTRIQQYETLKIQYYISTPENQNLNIKIKFGETVVADNNVETNKTNEYAYIAFTPGTYSIIFEIGGINYILGEVIIITNTTDLPTLNVESAEYCFQIENRNNNEENPGEYIWTDMTGKTIQSSFEHFLWGTENGWIYDNIEQQPALKLTNGAKFSVLDYYPLEKDALDNKVNTDLTIELDFKLSNITDFSKPLISCLGYYGSATGERGNLRAGFEINGVKALLNTSSIQASTMNFSDSDEANETDNALQSFTQYLDNGVRIHLTYVLNNNYIFTYLDGILSGIVMVTKPGQTESQVGAFKDDIASTAIKATLNIDSTFGDIDIYGIRIFRESLSHQSVLYNYIASFLSLEKKLQLYKQNSLFDKNNNISYDLVVNNSESLKIPYVLLTGGIGGKDKWNKKPTKNLSVDWNNIKLPTNKKDFRLFSMQMYLPGEDEPVIDIPIDVTNEEGTVQVNRILDMKNNNDIIVWKPTQGVQIYGQGTSSMEYPVKNLRLKFINKADYPFLFNKKDYSQEIICFKADYMESSSSHNTGTGNLIENLYNKLQLKTPAQKFKEKNNNKLNDQDKYPDRLITAITGFPIICFYRETEEDEYSFIGRYNFNLDKATPEPFGFSPKYVEKGEFLATDGGTYMEVDSIGYKTKTIDGKTVLDYEDGNPIDIIQCWEMKNNITSSPTKFLNPREYTIDNETKRVNSYNDFFNETTHFWTDFYEDRYPDKYVSIYTDEDPAPPTAADNEALENGFFRLSKWLNSTAVLSENNDQITELSLPSGPVYYQTRDTSYNSNKIYYDNDHFPIDITTIYSFIPTESSQDTETTESSSIVRYLPNTTLDSDNFKQGLQLINELNDIDLSLAPTFIFQYVTEDVEEAQWNLQVVFTDGNSIDVSDIDIENFGFNFVGQIPIIDIYYTVTTEISYEGWSRSAFEKFDRDTKDYRLAKFKNEFTEYLDVDFCAIYYVLTLLLVMMDSRAKNMMLASWDSKIWYPIFYDMDTMLGVNNVGYNKFEYDVEDDFESHIFNGFDSVLWNNFKECFSKEIIDMYEKVRQQLNLKEFLNYYNDNQADAWSESIITADAVYKFIDPFIYGFVNGLSGSDEWVPPYTTEYFYAAQGKRSYHRHWWLNNRLKYLDGKYIAASGANYNFRMYSLPEQKNNSAMQNCIAQTPPNHRFTLTSNHKAYLSMKAGGIVYGPLFTQANTPITLGPTMKLHEVETYLYGAETLLDIGDLSDKYLGSFKIFGTQLPLLELKFGKSSRSHRASYSNYYNKLLTDISVNSSDTLPYLKKINVARCTGLKTLNLSYFSKLEEVDAEGAKMNKIIFPTDSILSTIYVPNTLTELTLKNQPRLNTIEFDDITQVTNLTTIQLDNLPNFNIYPIIRQIFPQHTTTSYDLKNIYIKIDEITEYERQSNSITTSGGQEILNHIAILDNIQNTLGQPIEGTIASNLTGTLEIDIPVKVNEYDIYNLYNQIFPNLKIVYSNQVDLIRADTVDFYGAGGNILLEIKTDGTKSLKDLLDPELNGNKILIPPSKAPTVSETYIFSGIWKDQNNNYYLDDRVEGEYNSAGYTITGYFTTFKPNNDLFLDPIFIAQTREWEINLYDNNKRIILKDSDIYTFAYGSVLQESDIKEFIPELINYTPSLPIDENTQEITLNTRYALKGWTKTNYIGTGLIPGPDDYVYNFTNKTTYTVSNINELYAYYVLEDCTEVGSPLKYFSFEYNNEKSTAKISLDKEVMPNDQNIKIRLTIPNTIIHNDKNYTITQIGDFGQNLSIESIFVLEDTQIDSLIPQAFYEDSNLAMITLNKMSQLEELGNQCLAQCSNLKYISLDYDSLKTKNILPSSLKKIGQQCFRDDKNLRINDFRSLNNCFIGPAAFGGVIPSVSSDQEPYYESEPYRIFLPSYIVSIISDSLDNESSYNVTDSAPGEYDSNIYLLYATKSTNRATSFESFGFDSMRNKQSWSSKRSYLTTIIIPSDGIFGRRLYKKYGVLWIWENVADRGILTVRVATLEEEREE